VQWRRTSAVLVAAGYRVIVPDLPGHGRSEPYPDGPVEDLGTYAEWLVRLLDALEIERFNVMGCSIGGKITLDLACRVSDRIDAAISMAGVAHRPGLPEASQRRELEDSASPSRSDRTYLGTLAAVGALMSETEARLVATMHRREDPVISTSDLVAWSRHDIVDQLDRITCPLHVIGGVEDYWVRPELVHATAAAVPHARLTMLEGVGHYPMEELPEFGQIAVGWLDELRRGRA
jgi:pimeloyl-ACP methyl ester carboxylesterase